MKLTLQLVVVVVNASTKFRDNLFKFTPYTIIIYKVGDTTCHLTGPDQRAAKKMRPGHCKKKIHPGSLGVTFLETDTPFAQSHPPLLEKYLIEGNCSS